MNADLMSQYIEVVADRLLVALSHPKVCFWPVLVCALLCVHSALDSRDT